MDNLAYLMLGGNLGDVAANFHRAAEDLSPSIVIQKKSRLYTAEARGMENAPAFLNQAWEVQTGLTARELLQAILQTEKKLGRSRPSTSGNYENRAIDIDILFFNEELRQSPELTLPHPHLHERNFVLIPLSEVAPNLLHPRFQKTVRQMLNESEDLTEVQALD